MRIRFSFLHENRVITVTFVTTLNSFIILGKKENQETERCFGKELLHADHLRRNRVQLNWWEKLSEKAIFCDVESWGVDQRIQSYSSSYANQWCDIIRWPKLTPLRSQWAIRGKAENHKFSSFFVARKAIYRSMTECDNSFFLSLNTVTQHTPNSPIPPFDALHNPTNSPNDTTQFSVITDEGT